MYEKKLGLPLEHNLPKNHMSYSYNTKIAFSHLAYETVFVIIKLRISNVHQKPLSIHTRIRTNFLQEGDEAEEEEEEQKNKEGLRSSTLLSLVQHSGRVSSHNVKAVVVFKKLRICLFRVPAFRLPLFQASLAPSSKALIC